MISALFSFFGGTAFRMIWGEIASWLTAAREHRRELDMMRLQGELDAAQFVRNQDAIKLQAELGVQTIRVQGDYDLSKIDAATFERGVELTGGKTGIWLVDLWNGLIRPALATECMLLWSLHLYRNDWALDDNGWSLVGAALGIFVADRTLMKRGK